MKTVTTSLRDAEIAVAVAQEQVRWSQNGKVREAAIARLAIKEATLKALKTEGK